MKSSPYFFNLHPLFYREHCQTLQQTSLIQTPAVLVNRQKLINQTAGVLFLILTSVPLCHHKQLHILYKAITFID
jgi:hypothetical protein